MLWFTCVEAIRVLGMQKVWQTLAREEYSKIRPWLASSQQGLFTPNPAALPHRAQRVRGYCFTNGHKAFHSQISGSMQTWTHLKLQAQTWPWMSEWTRSSEGTPEWQSGANKYSQFSTVSTTGKSSDTMRDPTSISVSNIHIILLCSLFLDIPVNVSHHLGMLY